MTLDRRGFFATVAGLASIPLLGKIPVEKVPAMLTPGEFVVSRAFIEKWQSKEFLEALNQPLRQAVYTQEHMNKIFPNA